MKAVVVLLNSGLAAASSFLLSTTQQERESYYALILICLVALGLAFRATQGSKVPFARLSWVLSALSYGVLVMDAFLGGFGRLFPLELIFAPAAALTGLLSFGASLVPKRLPVA